MLSPHKQGVHTMSSRLHCTARSAASAGSSELPLSATHCAAIRKEDTEELPRRQPRSHTNGLHSHTCVTISGTWVDSKTSEVKLQLKELKARGLCSHHRPTNT